MRLLSLALLSFVACGGSSAAQPPPEAAPNPGEGASASAPATSSSPSTVAHAGKSTPTDDPPPSVVPSQCADPSAAVCSPPSDFVDRLCAKPHPGLSLALFGKATPFTRMYLRGKLDELAFDEEVLALRYHGVPKGGIQVGSGAGSYDVLRWDGTCSMAVDADMLTKTRPSHPRAARIPWHRLADDVQSALIAGSDAVKQAHKKRGKECQGAMTGDVSAACTKADSALVDAVVDYVRGGGTLPEPAAP